MIGPTTVVHSTSPGRGRRGTRAVIYCLVSLAAALFVWSRRADLFASFGVLSHLSPAPLVVALGLSGAAIVNRGGLIRSAHRAVGLQADLSSMTRVSAAAYALNKVVKTGGLGGIALFVRHGNSRDQPAADVTAAYVLSSASAQVALLMMIVLGAAGAALGGTLGGAWLLGSLVVAAVGVSILGALGYAVKDLDRVRTLYAMPHRIRATAYTVLRRPALNPPDLTHADRFYGAAAAARQSPRSMLVVLGHAVAAKLLGAGVLAASLAATGVNIGLPSALAVYSLALIAAAVGILPGGIGAVEASMTSILGSFGIALPIAIAAVLTFRLLDLWLPLLAGLVSARGLTKLNSGEERWQPQLQESSLLGSARVG